MLALINFSCIGAVFNQCTDYATYSYVEVAIHSPHGHLRIMANMIMDNWPSMLTNSRLSLTMNSCPSLGLSRLEPNLMRDNYSVYDFFS